MSKKKFEVRVNQMEPQNRMGRISVPFRISFSPEGFDRFLNTVPLGQRNFFEDRAQSMGEPAVEVNLPETYQADIHSGDPRLAVLDMYSLAMENKMFATADVLLHVTKVVA